MKGNMRIYGAGGCGLNIVSAYANSNDEPGVAKIHPAFVDTSRSNLVKAGITDEATTFLLKGKDGSGGIRGENHDEIALNIKQLLQQLPPEDFNVVVFAASGGSGSVFGPLLVKELLLRDLPVLAVVVGSTESAIRVQNTVNTLKTLENFARLTKAPVVMHYSQNTPDVKHSEVDHRARVMIGGLAYLVSGQNHGLDSRDIRNWVRFDQPTKIEPCLATVDFFVKADDANAVRNPIAIASLYASADTRDLTVVPDYDCAGVPNEPIEVLEKAPSLHYVISTDEVPAIYEHAAGVLEDLNTRKNARVAPKSLVSRDDDVADTGMVL